jgi:hypothetical protein
VSSSAATIVRTPGFNISRIARHIFSFPLVLVSLLIPLTVLTLRSRFSDPDMWWHLRTGQIIWTTHRVLTADQFSFTAAHQSSIPHEWFSQLTIYFAYRLGGFSGLMAWLCISSVCLCVVGYLLCCLYSSNLKVSLVGALVVWLFATVGFAIRPHMIGYNLLIFELLLLELGRTRNARWFWGLPPLFLLWINAHGSFFLGMAIAVATYALSFIALQAGSLVSQKWAAHRRSHLAWSLALSSILLFANPVGKAQIFYPLDTLLHQPISLKWVQEWQPLQITDGRGLLLLALLLCIFLLVLVRRSELRLQELCFLVLGTWLAMRHQRMLFVFGILSAPIFSRMIAELWDGYDSEHDRPLLNACVIASSLLVAVLAFPSHRVLAAQVESANPVEALAYVKAHRLSGPMMNEYLYGGYLIWAAPEHPVFMDGRADVYEWTGVMEEYALWATLQADSNLLLDKYKVEFCLLSAQSPMTHVLRLMPNWKLAYADAQAVVFVRASR